MSAVRRPQRYLSGRAVTHLVDRVLRWIEPEDNPSAVVYGTIAVGLLLAAERPALETYPRVVSGTGLAIVLYWLAHAYAAILGERFSAPRPLTWGRVAHGLRHEWAIVKGAATPLVALVVTWPTGAGLDVAVSVALWTAVVALVAFEVVAGVRARLGPAPLLGGAALGAGLGSALLLVKLVLD